MRKRGWSILCISYWKRIYISRPTNKFFLENSIKNDIFNDIHVISSCFRGSNIDNEFEVRLSKSIVLNAINFTIEPKDRFVKSLVLRIPKYPVRVNHYAEVDSIGIDFDYKQTRVNKVIKRLHHLRHPRALDRYFVLYRIVYLMRL